MKHIEFEGANKILFPPRGHEDKHITALNVREEVIEGTTYVMSVWEPTHEERLVLATGGAVKLTVMGAIHPPLKLEVVALGKSEEVAS